MNRWLSVKHQKPFLLHKTHPGLFWVSLVTCIDGLITGLALLLAGRAPLSAPGYTYIFNVLPDWAYGIMFLVGSLMALVGIATNRISWLRIGSFILMVPTSMFAIGFAASWFAGLSQGWTAIPKWTAFAIILYRQAVEPVVNPLSARGGK